MDKTCPDCGEPMEWHEAEPANVIDMDLIEGVPCYATECEAMPARWHCQHCGRIVVESVPDDERI